MNRRLVNENAFEMGQHCGMALGNLLTEEELQAAKELFFEIIREGLEKYELQVDRMNRRLRPLQN